MNLLLGGNDSLGEEQMTLPREIQTSYNEVQEPPGAFWTVGLGGSWIKDANPGGAGADLRK